MRTLPSYLGEYEAKTEILPGPSLIQWDPFFPDTSNFQAILFSLTIVTLPLHDPLRVRPTLWEEVHDYLTQQGMRVTRAGKEQKNC